MAKWTPEQEASYALIWDVARSNISKAAQLEYDRLKANRERAAALAREAATLAGTVPPDFYHRVGFRSGVVLWLQVCGRRPADLSTNRDS
jgi:hypothetical protein